MSVNACLKLRSSERGAVLIMALLIVSVVAGLAVKFTDEYQLGLAKAESRWHGAQARSYLLAAETVASYVLEMDPDPAVDYPEEGWGGETPVELGGVWLFVSITDAQSRMNLNDLAGGNLNSQRAHSDPGRYTEMQRRFIRLLQTFDEEGVPLNPDEAIAVLEAVVDWIDRDNDVSGFGGAESEYYLGLDPEYLPANRPFASVEELRMVRHVTPELMELLRPHLEVLPAGLKTNVNTMSPRLLRTINSEEDLLPLSQSQVELLMQGWPVDGYYPDVNSFRGDTVWASLGVIPETGTLSVSTSHFAVNTIASLVEQRRAMRSILRRSNDELEVVRRNDVY